MPAAPTPSLSSRSTRRVKRSRSLAWHPSGSSFARPGHPPGALGPGRFLRTDPVHRQLRAKEECAWAVARVCTASLAAAPRTGAGHGRSSARFRFRDHGDDLPAPAQPACPPPRVRHRRGASAPLSLRLDAGGAVARRGIWHACGRSDDNRRTGCRGESGALPEVAGDAAQLVDPLDDEGMAEAMLRFSKSPPWRRRLSNAGSAAPGSIRGARALRHCCRPIDTFTSAEGPRRESTAANRGRRA